MHRRILTGLIVGLAVLTAGAVPALAEPDAFSNQINADSCQLLRVDAGTGAVAEVGAAGSTCLDFLARSPADELFAITGDSDLELVRVDSATAAVTPVGPLGVSVTGAQFVAMTFDPAGHLWATINSGAEPCASEAATCLYSLDPTTGAATLVGGSAVGPVTGLAADCSGLYAATFTESVLYRVDGTSGALAEIGPTGVMPAIQGMSFAPDGTLWALGAQVAEAPFHSYRIDPATGTATEVATLTGYAENPFDQGGFATTIPHCVPVTPVIPVAPVTPSAPAALAVTPLFTG
jgi:streptogramin lyase